MLKKKIIIFESKLFFQKKEKLDNSRVSKNNVVEREPLKFVNCQVIL